jgi:hypothetical protein
MPAASGFFLGYDEIRHMHSCALCRAEAPTAGALLAWSVGKSVAEVRAVRPNAELYFWNDMFDPYHNAVDGYYYVEGDIAGSWEGLPPGAIIMNWNLGKLTESLTWFAGKDASGKQPHAFRQIIAGYYDTGDGAATANDELTHALGIPGVVGAMYTTWADDYGQLASYANTVRSRWGEYRSSLAKD